jgi:hypothetical protein
VFPTSPTSPASPNDRVGPACPGRDFDRAASARRFHCRYPVGERAGSRCRAPPGEDGHLRMSARGLALVASGMGAFLMLWGLLRFTGLRRHRTARHLRDRTAAMLAHPALSGSTGVAGLAGAFGAATSGYLPDPFRTYEVQLRLTALSARIREPEDRGNRFSRARRRQAALSAYDDALAEACRLAGAPLYRLPGMDRDVGRQLEELALDDRGWTW